LAFLFRRRRGGGAAVKSSLRRRLGLEQLEDRLTPSGMLDLTTPGAGGVINGVIYQQFDPQPTGTGVIHSFVRLQSHGPGATIEQGYNTDFRPVQFDEKTSPEFTRSLHLSELPTTVIEGITYRVVMLDINQKHSASLLSLDEVRIYVSGSPNLTGYDPTTHQLAGLNAAYDLDAGGDSWIKLEAGLSHGSGSGDMRALIPESVFASANPDPYVYLYSKFGVNLPTNGGFEEWAPGTGALPQTSSLSGSVLNESTNAGLPGVIVTLFGVDSLGQTVLVATTTDANGFFQFTGLLAGTYTITEQPPTGFRDDHNTIGTAGGSTSVDQFTGIPLNAGINGSNYIFRDLFTGGGS
jgi:hypothetical protein